MKKLKIGVIGTGHMGKNHVRVLSEEKSFDLIGVYDANIELAHEVANKIEIQVYEDLDELLNVVEAVVIAVPSSLHKDIAVRVAEAGVHALVEKPLATTSEDALTIKNIFEKQGLKLAVGHIERFNPVFRELQKLVESERIYCIESVRYSPYSGSGRITDTSVVEDLMIHDIDLVCALMKEKRIKYINGIGEIVRSDRTDFATGVIRFEDDSHAVINASRVSQNKERRITVHTVEKCIIADLLERTLSIYKSTNLTIDLTRDNSYVQDSVVQKVFIPLVEPLRAELISFYDSVKNNEKIPVDGESGVKAIRICEEIINNIKN